VLFPTANLPLRIFEPRYVDLIGRCMRESTMFGVVGISRGVEAGGPAQTYSLGTLARIVDFDQGSDGLLNVVIRGENRFAIRSSRIQADALMLGMVTEKPHLESLPIPPAHHDLVKLLVEINTNAQFGGSTNRTPESIIELAYGLAQILPIPIRSKIDLLSMEDPLLLLEQVSALIAELRQPNQ
jgi:uncharacterized protein